MRDILADPYTHPNAKEEAATALCGFGPDLRAEALAALRAIIADPLADCHDRRFAARGLASAGFPAEAASALNAILADPQAGAWDKAFTAFAFEENTQAVPGRSHCRLQSDDGRRYGRSQRTMGSRMGSRPDLIRPPAGGDRHIEGSHR